MRNGEKDSVYSYKKRRLEDDSNSLEVAEGDTKSKQTIDDDLTSLTWLQDKNLLKGIHLNSPVVPVEGEKSATVVVKEEEEDTRSNDLEFDETICPDLNTISLRTTASVKHPFNVSYDPKVHINSKPPFSFSCLIFMSIENSPVKALRVKDIYNWIIDNFPFYKTAPIGWKNSVRHNLSLNKCFQRVEKGQNVLGKGCLWTVDPIYRPNLLQALRRAPFSFSKSSTSNEEDPPDSQNEDFDELNDVDAANAMLVLKHGPNVSFKSEIYSSKSMMASTKTNFETKLVKNECEGIDDNMTFEVDNKTNIIKTERYIVDLMYPNFNDSEDTESFSSSLVNNEKYEEQQKIEGASLLLNLAGISTTPSSGLRNLRSQKSNETMGASEKSPTGNEEERFKPRFIRKSSTARSVQPRNKGTKRKSVNTRNGNNNNQYDNRNERYSKKSAKLDQNFFSREIR